MPQNVASDQDLHCLLLIQQGLDRSAGNNMDLFKFLDKYDKDLTRLHTHWAFEITQKDVFFFCLVFYLKCIYFVLIDHILSETICLLFLCSVHKYLH